jgi:hypothetical protein
VYAPGSKSVASRDVARASFSQRYATLGDEDVTYALGAAPSDLQKEAAVAAMVDRTATVKLGFEPGAGKSVHGGLIADERPIAAQIALGSDSRTFTWTMPGRAWSSERLAFFVDRNANGKCDTDGSDTGAIAPFAETIPTPSTWLSGEGLRAVCDALQVGASRE